MSGVETALIITAAVGAGVKLYGDLSGASAARDAKEAELALKNQQADEIVERQRINEGIIRRQGNKAISNYATAITYGGGGGAGTIGAEMAAKAELDESIALSRRDADFKVRMLRAGASIEAQLASDLMTASYFTGIGSLLGTGANTAAGLNAMKKTEPKGLG